ncbi:MAG: AAA family ATPase [Bacteroidales bacterium]|nr:AAA family ATPase [Bacteroidales bacterium]
MDSRKNGQIKIITGIRRCGKSYLLSVLYRDYLLSEGVKPEQIITLELDNDLNARYRNPLELGAYLRKMVENTTKDLYILLDEIHITPLTYDEFYAAYPNEKRFAWRECIKIVMKRSQGICKISFDLLTSKT